MNDKEYLQKLAKYRIISDEASQNKISSYIILLESLDRVEKSSVALYDMADFEYKFLSNDFNFMTGSDSSEASERGMPYFFDLVDKDDLTFYFDTSIDCLNFLYSIPPEERKDYKICLDFRIKSSENKHYRIIQQWTVLELNSKGDIWLILILNDISPLHDQDVPARRYVERLSDGKRVLFDREDSQVVSPITPRQIEILRLISLGYGSKDIADYLEISVSTVNNHRQHILARMNAASTADVIRMAYSLKLL